MMTFTYHNNSQLTWIYPGWYTKLDSTKLPTDSYVKHGYYKVEAIFECEAEGIKEADKLFEEALNTGKILLIGEKKKPNIYDINKMPNISCKIEKLTFLKRVKKFLTHFLYYGLLFTYRRELA